MHYRILKQDMDVNKSNTFMLMLLMAIASKINVDMDAVFNQCGIKYVKEEDGTEKTKGE